MMRFVFTIDRGDISPERLEEYKTVLNALVGYDAEWEQDDDIPDDDVRDVAIRIYKQYSRDPHNWSLVDLITDALMAERKRRLDNVSEAE